MRLQTSTAVTVIGFVPQPHKCIRTLEVRQLSVSPQYLAPLSFLHSCLPACLQTALLLAVTSLVSRSPGPCLFFVPPHPVTQPQYHPTAPGQTSYLLMQGPPTPTHPACDTQADNKLLVVRCGSVLLAVDQHAADERVQLEALQQQLSQQMHVPAAAAAAGTHHPSHSAAEGLKTGGAAGLAASGGLLKQQRLQRPQPLNLTLLEARALQQHQALIESWGWRLAAAQGPATTATVAAAAAQPASSSGGCSSSKAAATAGRGGPPAVSNVAGQGKLSATTSAPAGAAAGQPGDRMHTSSSGSSKLDMAAGAAVDSSIKAEQQQPSLAPTPTAGAATAATAEGGPLMLGTSQAVVLQAVPVLAGVQLGAVDLQVGSCLFANMTNSSCCHSYSWQLCS